MEYTALDQQKYVFYRDDFIFGVGQGLVFARRGSLFPVGRGGVYPWFRCLIFVKIIYRLSVDLAKQMELTRELPKPYKWDSLPLGIIELKSETILTRQTALRL